MATNLLSLRTGLLDTRGARANASPLDHALTLLLADETEAALRWSAAALERDPLRADALIVTARLLDQMGRTRAAIDGLRLAVRRAIDLGDLPLAVAAIADLRILGADVRVPLDEVATAFGRGAARGEGTDPPSAAPSGDFLEPLSPLLAGPPLASKAAQIVLAAKQAHEAAAGGEPQPTLQWPLFGALSRDTLIDLIGAFQMITVPAGQHIIDEGDEGDAAYIVVRGEVEISRRAAAGHTKVSLALSSLGEGAFFGELALLSRLPSTTSATAKRPSILLLGKRDALAALAAKRPELAIQLAAHCRRSSLANLGWTSAVISLIPDEERAAFVERLEMRVFEKGERIVSEREDAKGLHLVVSGEVAIVGREWSERVLLATLGPGETVGEVELVLCRQSYTDAIAVRPTAALFLSREEYKAIVQDRPAVLHGLYATAVRRDAETRLALDTGSTVMAGDWLVEDDQTETRVVTPDDAAVPLRVLPPASASRPRGPARAAAPPPLPSIAGMEAATPTMGHRGVTPEDDPPIAAPMPVRPVPAPAGGQPSASQAAGHPSVAPTSASVRSPPVAASKRGWLAPVHVATIAALAAGASVVMMFALSRNERWALHESALGAATTTMAAPPPLASSASEPETVATAAAVSTTWTAVPITPVTATAEATAVNAPPPRRAAAPVRITRPAPAAPPRAPVTTLMPPGSAETPPGAPAAASHPAVAASAQATSTVTSGPSASTGAPAAILLPAPHGPDDFGGRE